MRIAVAADHRGFPHKAPLLRALGADLAIALARAFVGARFSGAPRHARRLAKVFELESSGA